MVLSAASGMKNLKLKILRWVLNCFFKDETILHNIIVTRENNVYMLHKFTMSGSVILWAKKATHENVDVFNKRILRILSTYEHRSTK